MEGEEEKGAGITTTILDSLGVADIRSDRIKIIK